MKNYTLFKPSLKKPGRLCKFMLRRILSGYERGKAGTPSEIASVLRLLSDENALPYISYMHIEGGAVKSLADNFVSYLSRISSKSALCDSFMSTNGWEEIPFYSVGLSSATSALYLALVEAGVKGGEVVTTSLNYVGVINAIYMAGATPVFVDIDPELWMMDPGYLEAAINPDTRAVVLTHFNQFADLSPYLDLYSRRGLEIPLIQDASVAMGSQNNGIHPGVLNLGVGGATVFSLATSKVLTGLGGAIVASNDENFLERILIMAYQGVDFTGGGAIFSSGGNFKMNDMNAVIALEQLKRADEIFEARRKLKQLYDAALSPLVEARKITLQKYLGDPVVTHYTIKVPDRESLAFRLAKNGILLSRWHACHMEELCRANPAKAGSDLTVTEDLQAKLAFLPFYNDLTENDVDFISGRLIANI